MPGYKTFDGLVISAIIFDYIVNLAILFSQ